jgi:pentatricopeptide repeat protein
MNIIFYSGYIKNNQAKKAIDIFHQINNPDEVMVIIFFNACAQIGTNEALNLLKKVSSNIPKSFYSNSRLLTSMIDALIKCGDTKHAQSLFNISTNKILSTYNTMMNGFNKENNPSKTLDLFNQMKIDGIQPNFITYTCVIAALSQIGVYTISQSIVEQIPDSFFVDNQIHNALIDMWVSMKKLFLFFSFQNMKFRGKMGRSIEQNKSLIKFLNQIKLDIQR